MRTWRIESGRLSESRSAVMDHVRDILDGAKGTIHVESHQDIMDLGDGIVLPRGRTLILHIDGGDPSVQISVSETCCGKSKATDRN